jgi:hypothetical protein
MTLEPHDAQELDRLVLRILDIAGKIRRMSVAAQESPELAVALHGRKARQWIAQLEQWAAESAARMDVALILKKGSKSALKSVQKNRR